jgi:phage terminase small subunit
MVNPARKIGDTPTPKEVKFIRLVLAGESYFDAYRHSYAVSDTSTRGTLKTASMRVANRPLVRAALEAGRQELQDAVLFERAEIIREIARLALADPRGIVDGKGRLKLLHELDDKTAATVGAFEITDTGGIKYKFHDKNAALEKAAKILGLYARDNSQKTDPLAELLKSLSGNVLGVVPNPEPDDDVD